MEQITYQDEATALTGHVARPEGKPRAAILIFPTIINANPAMVRRAAMLAEAGYLAMIADFYGEPVRDFAHAGELAKQLRADPEVYRARIRAAISALRSKAEDLPIAAIGFCMGGQAVLEAARDGADLAAAVSFHGLLDTQRPAQRDAIKPRVLICHGDADPMVPRSQVLAFWEEMDAADTDWHFHSYSRVRHGFTDPSSDARRLDAVRYNANADRASWAAMLGLFDQVFG